jgi:hypothetical protein
MNKYFLTMIFFVSSILILPSSGNASQAKFDQEKIRQGLLIINAVSEAGYKIILVGGVITVVGAVSGVTGVILINMSGSKLGYFLGEIGQPLIVDGLTTIYYSYIVTGILAVGTFLYSHQVEAGTRTEYFMTDEGLQEFLKLSIEQQEIYASMDSKLAKVIIDTGLSMKQRMILSKFE